MVLRIPSMSAAVLPLLLSAGLTACNDSSIEPPPGRAPVAAAERRNIVLVTIDTLRADHLHCYGYPRATSPNLDRLAAQGVRFEQAIVQWPKTGPSMASLMTSTYGSTSGVMRTTLDQKVPRVYDLLPELLRSAGYQTFGVVANLSLSPKFSFDQGFDHYLVENANTGADHVSALARGLFEHRDPARPLFLWVHYLDPHAPYRPPPKFSEEFVGDEWFESDDRPPVPVDPRVADSTAQERHGNQIGQIPKYAYLPGKERIRDYVAQYDGDIRFLDEHLGRLMLWLGEQGHLERALLVITADHGESLGDHDYFFEHGRFPYDDCARVPLILIHPEWAPARVAAPVALLDVAPTLLELVGIAPGWQFEGRSLVDWLRAGDHGTPPRPVFTQSGYEQEFETSVRDGRYKLIRIGSRRMAELLTGRPYELYDVLADPGETRNLVDERPEVFESLRTMLDAFVEDARARVPPPPDGDAFTPTDEERRLIDALGYADDKRTDDHR